MTQNQQSMETPLISLVVPMYKVEPFIAECLESILNQSYRGFDIEVIAVNDGSPDRSEEIARRYSHKDRRIKIIRQSNGGLSSARNTGLGYSSGEYIWFIDSDDWISEKSIQTVADKILAEKPEAIHICGADMIDGKPSRLFTLEKCIDAHHTGMEMLRGNNFHGVVQYTIYKRDFLQNNALRFFEGIYHEDTEFSPRAYYFLKDVVCIDEVLYLKRVNEDSITRTVNAKKNYDLVKVSHSLRNFAETIADTADRKYFMRLSSNALKMAMTNETRLMDKETRRKFNNHLRDNGMLLKSFFESDRALSKVEGILLTLFSGNMLFVNNNIFQNRFLRKISK